MTAAFPWYDLPSVRWANDVLWKATGLGGALDRDTAPHAQWRSEDLVVSQACGLDLFLGDAPIEPVLALPALAHTATGRRPLARSSATSRPNSAMSMRKWSPERTRRMFSRRTPAISAARFKAPWL